jgi:hypothetical protein
MAQLAESEPSASAEAGAETEPAEAVEEVVGEAAPSEAEPGEAVATEGPERPEGSGSGDDGPLAGVMDDRAGSVEPTETTEPIEREVAVTEEGTSGEAEPASEERPAVAEPVGVMEPDAQRVPAWPAPAPRAEAAQVTPTMDNTSAAVRLLRSVAPWTAPTHAGNPPRSDPE